jgi:hypothetical protein
MRGEALTGLLASSAGDLPCLLVNPVSVLISKTQLPRLATQPLTKESLPRKKSWLIFEQIASPFVH